MRGFRLQLAPLPVHAPEQGRGPGRAGFHHHHLQARDAFEHPFHHQAHQPGLAGLGVPDHVLDIVRRPAAGGIGVAAMAEGVERHRQPGRRRGFIDRPVAPLPRRLPGAAQQQYLSEMRVTGKALDLRDGCGGILVRDHDRGFQPAVLAGPFLDLPLIHRMRHGAGQVGVDRALAGRGQRVEDAEFDIVGIQMLPGHEGQITAGSAAGRGKRIPARGHRLRLGIGRPALIGLAVGHPEGFKMFLPALGQPRIQRLHAGDARMDVAIGDHQPVGRGQMGPGSVQNIDVHDVSSLLLGVSPPWANPKRGNACSGLSIVILRISSAEKPSGIASCPSNCQCG